MKKILTFLTLGVITSLTLAGCNSASPAKNSNITGTPTETINTPSSAEQKTAVISQTRTAFGSQISPDGQSLLVEEYRDLENNSISHTLFIKEIETGTTKELLKVVEKAQDSFEPIAGERFPSDWILAGWSSAKNPPSSQKVYYVTVPHADGMGGAYPNGTIGGSAIYEVDTMTKIEKKIYDFKDSGFADGIVDFDSNTMQALTLSGLKVRLVDLKTGQSKNIFTFPENSSPSKEGNGISYAVFNGAATHVAIQTFLPQENIPQDAGTDEPHAYKLYVVDVATLNWNLIRTGASSYDLKGWKDEITLLLTKLDNAGKAQEFTILLPEVAQPPKQPSNA